MHNYKCILFDLDGTLLDSLEDLAQSMNSVLSSLGFPAHEVSAYRYFVGDGMETLVHRVLPPDKLHDAIISQCLSAMQQTYGQRWHRHTRPYPGIPELLDGLEALSIPKVILTNKPHTFTLQIVDRLLADWKFHRIAGARPEVPKKPDPAGALLLAAEMGIKPEDFIYLGDTNTDMQTARGANMFPVGALWGFRTAEELKESGAEDLATVPLEILRYFKQGGKT